MASNNSPGSKDRRQSNPVRPVNGGMSRPGDATSRQRRAALQGAVPDGRIRCPECLNDVNPRADGTMRAHQARKGISCIGGVPRVS